MAGVDLATMKKLMGHKHLALMLRSAHPAPGRKRAAVEVSSGGVGNSLSNGYNTRLIEPGDTSVSACNRFMEG
jgi:hypothetical protein